jgi:hypothetical protein
MGMLPEIDRKELNTNELGAIIEMASGAVGWERRCGGSPPYRMHGD